MKKELELIFGTRAVIEAIDAGKEIDKLWIQNDLKNELITELLKVARQHHLAVVKVPQEKLDRITRKNHQGVIAYFSAIEFASLDNILDSVISKGEMPFIVMLDRVTDVRNFGAIARSCEVAGVHALVIPAKGAARLGGDAMKASAGALAHIPVCRESGLRRTVKFMQNYGLTALACSEKSNATIYETDMNCPLLLVMGSEEDGVSEDILEQVDAQVKVPQFGKIASLNVANASSICVFEALRQRI